MTNAETTVNSVDPVWRLWIKQAEAFEGDDPFDVWNYTADVGGLYSMLISGHAEAGAKPKEECKSWSWEIEWVTRDGRRGEMLGGESTSRRDALLTCIHSMFSYMRCLFCGTGDLLLGDLPVDIDSRVPRSSSGIDVGVDVFDEFDWTPSIEDHDDTHDLWCHSIGHDEFYLTIEAPITKGSREPAPELGDWRWGLLDESDLLAEGTAPSRTQARELCVSALLEHLTRICTITEQLYDAGFPTEECTDRERPDRYQQDLGRQVTNK